MTTEHLRPLLDQSRDNHNLFIMAERMARTEAPPSVNDAIRLSRNHAEGSGALWQETISRLAAPFQHAMTTRAGTKCIAHAVQALTEVDPLCTLISVDGIGAFDLISRATMLGAGQALPFVRLFYGQPSQCLWADDMGTVHHVDQGEGGEQGDALMPLLFSLGHGALQAVQRQLAEGERVVRFPRRCVRDHSQPRQGGSHLPHSGR